MPEYMAQKVRLYPLTRVHGRAEIEVLFTDDQRVSGARVRALESRRIDDVAVGMPAVRVPHVVARSCGSCGPFHQLAACMAVEDASGAAVPEEAGRMRELLAWLLLASSHISTITYLALPDFALPLSDAAVRNVTGIYTIDQGSINGLTHCMGQLNEAIRVLAGNPFRVPAVVPGGVSRLPDPTDATRAAELLASCEDDLREIVRLAEMLSRRESHMLDSGARMRGSFACSMKDGGSALLADSVFISSFRDDDGVTLSPGDLIASLRESPVDWSFIVPVSVPGREPMIVGPLARINAGFGTGAPIARMERQRAIEQWQFPVASEFFHLMSLSLEAIRGWEKASELIARDFESSGDCCGRIELKSSHGCSVVDSPEGLLCHEVSIGADGRVQSYRIAGPLQFNVEAMNEHVSGVAREAVSGLEISEAAAARLQLAARAFNPCIQCGTH